MKRIILFTLLCWSHPFSPLLSQVILSTIERHKQNSETFNKAFNSSLSREDDHVPESPVSLTFPRSVGLLISGLVVRCGGTPDEFITVCVLSAWTALQLWMWPYRTHHTHIKKLFHFSPDSCSRSVCEPPSPELSHDLIGKAQVKVYTKLVWICFDPLWAGWTWTLAKLNLTQGLYGKVPTDT